MAPVQGDRRCACARAAGGRLFAAGEVRGGADGQRPAGACRGGRPHLLWAGGADQRDRAFRGRARDQVRDLRDHADQGLDHRRAALAGLGAAFGSRPGAGDRACQRQARASAAARADRRGDGRRAEDGRRGVPGRAGADLQLDDRGAGRAVERERLERRRGVAAGHADRRERAGPGGGHGPDRSEGSRGRRDRQAARAREARGGAVLLREPDPREIGEVLGVTESRVSQLHTKAVLRLRGRLAD